MILASFISGSLLTALIGFIGYKFATSRKPLERQKAIIQKNLIRSKTLELVSASSNTNDHEKALTIYSIEQLSSSQQDAFSSFVDQVEKFKSVDFPKTISYLKSFNNEIYNMEPYISKAETLAKNFEDSLVLKMNHLDQLQNMVSYPYSNIPFDKLRDIKNDAILYKEKIDEAIKKEASDKEYNDSLKEAKVKASRIYDELVKKYDPYYYVTATQLRVELNAKNSSKKFDEFVAEIIRLTNLNTEIIKVISKAKLMVDNEPGFNLLDKNTIHGWLVEIANKDYMSTKNPFMEFNEDWKQFDSKRKSLARERGKREIWNLKKLNANNEFNNRKNDAL